MVINAAGLTPETAELSFADSSSVSAWARAVATAVKNEIINGYPTTPSVPGECHQGGGGYRCRECAIVHTLCDYAENIIASMEVQALPHIRPEPP